MDVRKAVPLIVASAIVMQQIDSTSLATALPSMAASLEVSPLQLHAVITAYLLSLGVFLPLSGWVADRFGPRNVFRVAIAIFTVASLLCGSTSDVNTLICARIVQGFGGAMMVPVGSLILVRSVPKSDLVAAMILMSLPAVIGPAVGPLLGGLITTIASWRWIFWINLPLGILGIVLSTLFIEEVPAQGRRPFDVLGFTLTGVGIGSLIFGLDSLSHGVRLEALIFAAAGAACVAGYLVHARRSAHPILDLNLFRLQTFRASVGGGSLFRMGFGAMPFMLPLLMQEVFGYTPLQSGAITFISAAGSFGMRTVARRILQRFGFRQVLVWNCFIASASIAVCSIFTPSTGPIVMMPIIFLGGVFRALQNTSINTIAFAEVDASEMSHATTLTQMAQRLSQSLGVAFAALMLNVFSGGERLSNHAFALTFLAVGTVSALCFLFFRALPNSAGDVIAGRAKESVSE